MLTLQTKLYEIKYGLDFHNNEQKIEFKWFISAFKIIKPKYNFKILNEEEVLHDFFLTKMRGFLDLTRNSNFIE